MTAATQQQQRRLVDLQQVDTAVRRLQHRRAHLPEQQALDEHSALLSQANSDYGRYKEQLDRLTLQQRRHESEIATVEARRKSEEGRMYSGAITSERELEALRHELSSLKGRKNDLEDSVLEMMEQREELEAMIAKLEAQRAELSDKVAELTSARDEAAHDIDAELRTLVQQREQIAAEVPPAIVKLYGELLARKQGVAVAELQGKTCSGCRLELTAIELEETRKQAQRSLARCAQCSRILIPT